VVASVITDFEILVRRINIILNIGCRGGEMSKCKHEPLKVNFSPFLRGVRPKGKTVYPVSFGAVVYPKSLFL
jgi:hypothetical protein